MRGKQFRDLHGEQLNPRCVVKLSRTSKKLYLFDGANKYLKPLNGADKVLLANLRCGGNMISVLKVYDSVDKI